MLTSHDVQYERIKKPMVMDAQLCCWDEGFLANGLSWNECYTHLFIIKAILETNDKLSFSAASRAAMTSYRCRSYVGIRDSVAPHVEHVLSA